MNIKKMHIMFFIITLLISYCNVSYASQSQKTIGVLQFNNRSDCRGIESIATDITVSELITNTKLRVVDRVNMDAVLNEQGLGHSGTISTDTAAKIGKINGINYIVIGTISDVRVVTSNHFFWNQSKAQVTISMQIIDSTSGVVVFASTSSGDVEKPFYTNEYGRPTPGTYSEYSEATQNAVKKLCDSFKSKISSQPATIYVAAINNGKIYLDLDKNVDITQGQIFTICQDEQIIRSPRTGEIIGTQSKEICQISIESVSNKLAIGYLTSGNISQVQIGDKAIRQ